MKLRLPATLLNLKPNEMQRQGKKPRQSVLLLHSLRAILKCRAPTLPIGAKRPATISGSEPLFVFGQKRARQLVYRESQRRAASRNRPAEFIPLDPK